MNYSEKVNSILEKNKLNNEDLKNLNSIYDFYDEIGEKRDYEDFIEDIYILYCKYQVSLDELSGIYSLNKRILKIWVKELHLDGFICNKKIEFKNDDITDSEGELILKSENKFEDEVPKRVMEFFKYQKNIKGRSEKTIKEYRYDLSLLFKFLVAKKNKIYGPIKDVKIGQVDDEFISKIELMDLYDFLNYLEIERENGTHTRSRKIIAIKSFFKFIHSKLKIIKEDITIELEMPKLEKRLPVYLTLEQSQKLLESLDDGDLNYQRDYCILTLFLNCGMRLSELCGIKTFNIKADTLTIVGKGNKERVAYLNDECINSINEYLKVRKPSKLDSDNEFLFQSSRRKPISRRMVQTLVKKHLTNVGFTDKKYSAHKLRHTAATLYYKHGNADMRALQEMLGHASIATTQIYAHVDNEQLRALTKSGPLSKR